MSSVTELRAGIAYVEAELRNIHARAVDGQGETRSLNPDEQSCWDEGVAYLDGVENDPDRIGARAELKREEHRADVVARLGEATTVPATELPEHRRETNTDIDVRSASASEVRSAALKHLERAESFADERYLERAEKLVNRGETDNWSADRYARQLAVTESDTYRQAWLKTVTGSSALLSDRERNKLDEARAMSLTDTSGGFAVPVVIDPTVLITDGTGLTGLMPFVRVEPVNNDAWKGVSAGHTVWGGRAEGAEAGADDSTFAQPTVNIHTTDAFVPASIEITMDFPGFVSQVGDLIADGYMDFVAEQLAVGAGDASNEGYGVFNMTATTVDVTSDNTFQAADIDKVWAALGERFRSRSTWFMNVDVENDIRGFGSGTATSRFTVDQTREGISLLNGRPVVLSDWAPAWSGTDAAKILAIGDFSRFLFAQRVGMTLEYIPHLFGTTNARPTGQRGWYAFARYGHDRVVQNAFRVLKNQTT